MDNLLTSTMARASPALWYAGLCELLLVSLRSHLFYVASTFQSLSPSYFQVLQRLALCLSSPHAFLSCYCSDCFILSRVLARLCFGARTRDAGTMACLLLCTVQYGLDIAAIKGLLRLTVLIFHHLRPAYHHRLRKNDQHPRIPIRYSKMQCIKFNLRKPQLAHSDRQAAQKLPEPIVKVILASWDEHDWRGSSDALADWLNARWKKTGYSVSRECVHALLVMNFRNASPGLGDHLDGAYTRTAQ